MPTQVIGRVIKAPAGWEWDNGHLVPNAPLGFTQTTFNALYAWAKKRSFGLEPDLNTPYHYQHANVHCKYKVWRDSWAVTEKWLGDGTWTLNEAYGKLPLGVVEKVYGGVAYYNSCHHCGRAGLRTERVGRRGAKKRLCAACIRPCATAGCPEQVFSFSTNAGRDADKCLVCVPRLRCRYCSLDHPEAELDVTSKGYRICGECKKTRTCGGCGSVGEVLKKHEGKLVCVSCYGKAVDAERAKHEKWDKDELPKGGSLILTSLPNRPIRTISIETEVDGDPTALANTLFNCGYVREAFVENYGARCPDGSAWPAFLKYDGSVSGGELINYLLNLDKKEHADSLLNVLTKLRSLEKLGKVAYHENCGGHIHIDAHNFSTDNIWRLVTGYNHIEDVIFRLAGAGYKKGHRTLVPGHDRANHGRGYSHPTAKGPWGVRSGAYRAVADQDRMTGLNFQPYLGSVHHCGCGAGAENLRSCKCKLPKCTIEWRVWNSQGNPRILHGWIAFMQALHAWADTPKEMSEDEERKYPVLAWTKKAYKDTSSAHKTLVLDRVKWIFTNLVFTDEEKDSLLYAFSKTDIAFPEGFLDELRAIPQPKNRTVKAPRNCSMRQEVIKPTPPEKPVFGNPRNDPAYRAGRPRVRW